MSSILVVDDDPNIRGLVADLLTVEGFQVQTAANGAEALETVRREAPAAIVLDLMMPVMDGWAFARECRKLLDGNEVPILAISAADNLTETAADLHQDGVRAVLAKPFDLDVLAGVVQRLTTHQ